MTSETPRFTLVQPTDRRTYWVGGQRQAVIVGGPETVRAALAELAERTGADELMITTMVHAHPERIRSYELLAKAVELGS